MRLPTLLRYGLWCGIMATAEANRREYAMATTWLPHLLLNSATLLLPDICRAVVPGRGGPAPRAAAAPAPWAEGRRVIEHVLGTLVRDNPGYVVYVAPLAVGYLLSHPRFNVYKGELGAKQVCGFGLDTLPHSATAFALTALIYDTAQAATEAAPASAPLAGLLSRCAASSAHLSGLALALVTLGWEIGEYVMHQHELALRGDVEKINMQWSVRDTVYDCVANLIGWGAAVAWRRWAGGSNARCGAAAAPPETSGDHRGLARWPAARTNR